MTVYSSRTAKNGRVLYFKDKKLVAKADIPEETAIVDLDMVSADAPKKTQAEVLAERFAGSDVELAGDARPTQTASAKVVAEPETKAEVKIPETCLVCGAPGEHGRYLNGQTLNLCTEHYQGTTLGELAQLIRERQIA